MNIYISGPMTGLPLLNFPAFEAATAALRALNYTVTSPHEMELDGGFDPLLSEEENRFSLREALERDLDAVIYCDAVALLPGYEASPGAAMEVSMATALGKPSFTLDYLLRVGHELG